MSNLTLDKIEHELRLLNAHMADANDIAMLSAFTPWPADLDNESRKALGLLRDKLMDRARRRADEANAASGSDLAAA
ncbi:MAG: hypothetical protein WD078_03290 [Woeseia sp.]